MFTHYHPFTDWGYLDPPVKYAVVPKLVKLRPDEITFVGSGGCGLQNSQGISVLTRVTRQ